MEAALVEIDRSSRKIAQMEKYIEEGSLSKSLFENLDAEKSRLADATIRKDKLSVEVASARNKTKALYSSDDLIASIRSGNPELRLKLKSLIAERVQRIDIQFEDRKPVQAVITLINGARDFILFPK